MNLDTLQTAKALEKQINAINKILKPIEDTSNGNLWYTPNLMQLDYEDVDKKVHCFDVPSSVCQIAMEGALESLKVARDKMIEELEKL